MPDRSLSEIARMMLILEVSRGYVDQVQEFALD